MKNRVFATFSCLTLLTAAAAFAQSNALLEANIPFEFRAGAKTLPAGHYDVRPMLAPDVLSIRCFECKAGAMILARGIEAREAPEQGTLVFHRYNNTYFLSGVWIAGSSHGRVLPQSKAERELARNGSPVPPLVEVALVRR